MRHSPVLPPDEATLHALVDRQLSADDAAAVLGWLQSRPEEAARVAAWQAQRAELQTLHADLLAAPLPEALIETLRRPPPPDPLPEDDVPMPSAPSARQLPGSSTLRAPLAWAAGLALATGLVAGWQLAPRLDALVAARGASRAEPPAPAFVAEAQAAHVVYLPEKRHPVEVGADEHEHLVQWLSRRLGTPLSVPRLQAHGFTLVGGRLLPGLPGPAAQAPAPRSPDGTPAPPAGVPRAQFMYEGAAGQRLTLYVTVLPAAAAQPAQFQLSRQGATASFYWLQGRLGYALSGSLERETLAAIARTVHAQLPPG